MTFTGSKNNAQLIYKDTESTNKNGCFYGDIKDGVEK